MKKKFLKDYLLTKDLNKKLSLDLNGDLCFHWADWTKTCDKKNLQCDLENLEETISKYKSIPLWIHFNSTQKKSNLYELYEHYLSKDKKSIQSPFFVSIGKKQGPYINYNSLSWLNPTILKNIVYQKLLFSQMQNRYFRLYWNSRPKIHLNNFYHSNIDIQTHAITANGIIFKVKGKNNMGRILNSRSIGLDMNLNPFIRTIRSGGNEFIENVKNETFSIHDTKNVYRFIIQTKNFVKNNEELQAKDNNDYHLFLAFEDLEATMSNFYIETPIRRFLENTENSFELDLIA